MKEPNNTFLSKYFNYNKTDDCYKPKKGVAVVYDERHLVTELSSSYDENTYKFNVGNAHYVTVDDLTKSLEVYKKEL